MLWRKIILQQSTSVLWFYFYVSLAEVCMRNRVFSGHIYTDIIFCHWGRKEINSIKSTYKYHSLKAKGTLTKKVSSQLFVCNLFFSIKHFLFCQRECTQIIPSVLIYSSINSLLHDCSTQVGGHCVFFCSHTLLIISSLCLVSM